METEAPPPAGFQPRIAISSSQIPSDATAAELTLNDGLKMKLTAVRGEWIFPLNAIALEALLSGANEKIIAAELKVQRMNSKGFTSTYRRELQLKVRRAGAVIGPEYLR